jgi:Kef-type K+ transport system membrane component KefB
VPALGFQLFLCIGFSISALPVLARVLIELDLGRTAVGTLALSAAALEDAIGWILLAAATALVTASFAGGAMVLQVAGLAAFTAVVLGLLGPWLGRVWRRGRERAGGADVITPGFLALLIVALLACSLATDLLGIFSIFGAFLLGVSLRRETELARVWRERYSGLVLVALVPVFFTCSGLRTQVGALTSPRAWLACGVVIATAALGKLAGCYLGARAMGEPPRLAAAVAVLMNTRGLMELVALNVGLELGLLSPQVFTMMVLMALTTTCMTMPLVRRLLPAVPAGETEPVVAGNSALAQ